MMRSLFSGVSGLKGHQTRMDVIGNNIANVNATGFKSSRVTFADTLSQTQTGASAPGDTVGGTNPKQIGLGTGVASIDLLFTDGSVQSTGKNTDLCMSGNGLFVVKSGNDTYYTRDGAFEFDADGNYVLPGNGMKVQGWMATDGVLTTNGETTDIQVQAGKSMAAQATATVTYANNLNSSVLTIKEISGGTVTATGTKTYTASTDGALSGSTTYPLTITFGGITTEDSTGTSYKVDDTYTKIYTTTGEGATASTDLTVTLKLADGSTVTGTAGTEYLVGDTLGTSTIESVTASGTITKIVQEYPTAADASSDTPVTLTMSDGTTVTQTSGSYKVGNSLPITTTVTAYDTLGNAHSIPIYFTLTTIYSGSTTEVPGNTWTVSVNSDGSGTATLTDGTVITMADTLLQFTTAGKYYSGSPTKSVLTLTNGSLASQSMAIDLSAITQFAGNSTINATADGNAAGTLKSVSIDSSGIITGVYTNGIKQKEAQIAVAQFTNASGLEKTGSSLYQESNNSGTPNVKTATDLGVTITPSALEMSNVDIANEFSDMIITQRGFQSNSKIITVGDEMLETLINMKR